MKIKNSWLKSAEKRVEQVIIDECCKILKCDHGDFKRRYRHKKMNLSALTFDELKRLICMSDYELRMEVFSAVHATLFVYKMNQEDKNDNQKDNLKN